MTAPLRVLIADDDESVRALCASVLMRSGFAVDAATDGRDALQKIEENDYSAVLLDLGMPFLHGATVASMVLQKKPEMMRRLIVITGAADVAIDPLFANAGAILHKPLTVDSLRAVVESCATATPVPDLNLGDETLRL